MWKPKNKYKVTLYHSFISEMSMYMSPKVHVYKSTCISKSICYGEKLPMAWVVQQQTALTLEINLSQYARETKHLTLRYTESFLVPDG